MRYARSISRQILLLGWLTIGACTSGAPVDPDGNVATVRSVTLSPSRDTIEVGQTFRLSVRVETENNGNPPKVEWLSNSPSVATVSEGVVLGVARGSTKIRAKAGEKADSAEVVVVEPGPAPVASLTVTPSAVTAVVGASVQLAPVAKDGAGNTLIGRVVTWSSSAPSIANVNASGLVAAVATGTASITATSEGKSASSSITITATAAPVASVAVTPGSASIAIGQTLQLTATLKDATGASLSGRAIAWASSNTGVATIGTDGKVSAVAAGTATMTATSEGKTGSATVTVPPPPPPPPPPPVGGAVGIWMSPEAIQALPASGAAWDNLRRAADADLSGGELGVRDEHNVRTMAAALVAARLNSDAYRAKVRESLRGVMTAPVNGGDPLAILRRLGTYAIAADLIGLRSFDPGFDEQFRSWLDRTRKTPFDGETVAAYHERRPNNWGTHAGVSRIAVALYLGDQVELERAAKVFKGWLGDRTAYAGFTYSELWWQADPTKPVGINPKGATRDGHSIDGVLPDDQRRAGSFTWPPQKENYIYTALEGALGQAVLLTRQGYDVWNWSDRALLRSFVWLHDQANYPAEGNDCWQPYIINRAYGTSFPAPSSSSPGKNIGWADWTHQR